MDSLLKIAMAVSTGGAATAVIVTVRLFLGRMREQDKARAEERKAFLGVIENHLHDHTALLNRVGAQLGGLEQVVGRLDAFLRSKN